MSGMKDVLEEPHGCGGQVEESGFEEGSEVGRQDVLSQLGRFDSTIPLDMVMVISGMGKPTVGAMARSVREK